jgi:hypothetical protein
MAATSWHVISNSRKKYYCDNAYCKQRSIAAERISRPGASSTTWYLEAEEDVSVCRSGTHWAGILLLNPRN